MVCVEWWASFNIRAVSFHSSFNKGETEFLDVWHEAYAAIMRYSRGTDGFWVRFLFVCYYLCPE